MCTLDETGCVQRNESVSKRSKRVGFVFGIAMYKCRICRGKMKGKKRRTKEEKESPQSRLYLLVSVLAGVVVFLMWAPEPSSFVFRLVGSRARDKVSKVAGCLCLLRGSLGKACRIHSLVPRLVKRGREPL